MNFKEQLSTVDLLTKHEEIIGELYQEYARQFLKIFPTVQRSIYRTYRK
ncbi:MAG: hypothetical protein ABH868_00415 [bacterium]